MTTSNGKEISQSNEKEARISLLLKLEKISLNQEATKGQYHASSSQAGSTDLHVGRGVTGSCSHFSSSFQGLADALTASSPSTSKASSILKKASGIAIYLQISSWSASFHSKPSCSFFSDFPSVGVQSHFALSTLSRLVHWITTFPNTHFHLWHCCHLIRFPL